MVVNAITSLNEKNIAMLSFTSRSRTFWGNAAPKAKHSRVSPVHPRPRQSPRRYRSRPRQHHDYHRQFCPSAVHCAWPL